MIQIIDPENGAPLQAENPHTLRAGDGRRWPVLDGIPFLRLRREALIDAIWQMLDAGDARRALVLALSDRDDHAKGEGPSESHLAELADGHSVSLRDAMGLLRFGPVADYFAHRWSAPTFLSGLSLLADYWRPGLPVIELACGIGQLLREAVAAGAAAIGVDVVFSKLWLARRYVLGPEAMLVCADVQHGVPLRLDAPAAVLCHDALYFLEEKKTLTGEMQRLAGREGAVLIGHAHNALFDQRGVSGWPLTPEQWADLLPGAALYDDRRAAEAWLAGRLAPTAEPGELQRAEAVSMASGARNERPQPVGAARRGAALRLNPLLRGENGRLRPDWPTASLANEYEDADYLTGEALPSASVLSAAARGEITPEIDRLARRRVLLDLPEAW